jgi:hypothetical protein
MGVAVVTEAAADPAVSAAEDMQVSAEVAMRADSVVATAQPALVMGVAVMARTITHPGPRQDATGVTATMGNSTMHREARLEARFMVLAGDRKIESLPSSLLGRQSILVASTSHEINPLPALRANPASSNSLVQLQRLQPGPTGLGRDRMLPTGSDSTLKQRKDCVTGKAKHLDGTTQNVIITITGKIASTTTMTGGVTIATLSFLSAEVFGVGMTAGGIPPGGTTHIIRITIITDRSMAMTGCNQTR